MENYSLLNLIKVLSGMGSQSGGDATAKNTAEKTDDATHESSFNAENKQANATRAGTLETNNKDNVEKFNYTYSVLERHEKMSNRIKNKRS